MYDKLYDVYTEYSKLYFIKLLYCRYVYYTLYSFIIREICSYLLSTIIKKGNYIFTMHMINIFSIILITRLFYLTKFCH